MAEPRRRSHVYAVTGVVTAVWLLLDQATKLLAVRELTDGPAVDLGFMDLRLVYNDGGAFSIPGPHWLFLGVTVLVAVLVVRVLPQTDRVSLAAAYGLVLGGALGNGADRIFRDGSVVDFFDLGWFPVFNVADIGITVGAALVALLMLLIDREEKRAAATPPPRRPTLDDVDRLQAAQPPAEPSTVARQPDEGPDSEPQDPTPARVPPTGAQLPRIIEE